MPDKKKLLRRLLIRGFLGQPLLGAAIFLPAGSAQFLLGWAYMAVSFIASVWACVYFYAHDPQLLERRLLRREKIGQQKILVALWKRLGALSLILSGFDYRFDWSGRHLAPVPLWLSLLGLMFLACGHILVFRVMMANSYASSIIQIEAGQAVIASGPYRLARHPMYLGFAMMGVSTPLALGSWVALPLAALVLPIIVLRLLNEEQLLQRELAGYADYCRQTPYRLIPFIW